MRRLSIFLGLAVVMFLRQLSHAGTPPLINFQGVLKDGSGNPVVDASYSVAFNIYDAATGGTNLWTETQSVSTTSGLFAVLLGAVNPIPDTAFKGSERWLGIAVSPDPEMPRQQLVSVGYAYRVNSVDSALGGHLTGDVTVTGNVGIGTDNPLGLLHLKGGNHKLLLESSGNADVVIGRADATRYGNFILADGDPSIGANNRWAIGLRNGDSKLHLYDELNSSNVMVLQPGGNVGIGTSFPGSPFVVHGASNWGVGEVVGNGINVEASIGFRSSNLTKGALGSWVLGVNNNAGVANAFSLYAANGLGAGSQVISVLPSGNVGIGSNVPVNRLDVEGGAAIGASYSGTNVAPGNGLLVEGNVGIGTAAPAARLHVHDVSGIINGSRLTLTQTTTGTTIFDGAALICASPNKAYWWNYENGPSIFGTNNLERMRIDSVGSVGFGIDTPTLRVHAGSVGSEGIPPFIAGTQIAAQATNPDNWAHMAIISGSIGQARLNFGDGSNDDQGSVAYNNSNDAMFFITAAAERMRITSTGNVGIGTSSPQGALDVNSTTGAFIVPRMTTTQRNALTPVNGMIIYNTDAVAGGRFEFRENGAWVTK